MSKDHGPSQTMSALSLLSPNSASMIVGLSSCKNRGFIGHHAVFIEVLKKVSLLNGLFASTLTRRHSPFFSISLCNLLISTSCYSSSCFVRERFWYSSSIFSSIPNHLEFAKPLYKMLDSWGDPKGFCITLDVKPKKLLSYIRIGRVTTNPWDSEGGDDIKLRLQELR